MTDKPPPAATPDGADPSMEDILASIRRILNEEEAPATAEGATDAPAEDAPAEDASVDDDILVLDRSMMVSTGEIDPVEPEPEPEPEPVPPMAQAEPPPVQLAPPDPSPPAIPRELPPHMSELLAPETAAAAASSVDSLMRTLTAGRATQVYSGGPTLEDMVRGELRPLLKAWLDTYLPPMVERLVRTEIERVVGRVVP